MGTLSAMVVLLAIAMVWLTLALVCSLVLWFQTSRKLTDTDRWCAWTDSALHRRYGSVPR